MLCVRALDLDAIYTSKHLRAVADQCGVAVFDTSHARSCSAFGGVHYSANLYVEFLDLPELEGSFGEWGCFRTLWINSRSGWSGCDNRWNYERRMNARP